MTKPAEFPDEAMTLSEEKAHRVLARAVELDARHASDVPLARLREIAREAGIGDRALDLAINELQSTAAPVQEKTSVFGRFPLKRGLTSLVRNAAAFAVAMTLIRVASRAAGTFDAGWPFEHAVVILANLVGVGLAVRLRGRVTAFVLAVTAIAQLAEYPMHLMFGIGTVQGGATKWALMLAAAGGLGLAALARTRVFRMFASNAIDEAVSSEEQDPATVSQQSRSLSLRLASLQ